MEQTLVGHPYIKSAIDIACWDILGKATQQPVYALMGGRLSDRIPFRIGLPIDDVEPATTKLDRLRKKGFFLFNLKVGDNPASDIERIRSVLDKLSLEETLVVDANRGWRVDEALWVMRSIPNHVQVYFEQPCATYEECLTVRRASQHSIIFDELADDLGVILRLHRDGAAQAITFKIARFGGLTKARFMRDLCVALKIPMHIQDPWGSSVVTAAVAHLSHSTPKRFLLGAWGGSEDVPLETASNAPILERGSLIASDRPGLGIEPRYDVLGSPIAEYS
jgi:L-alanine-DL-glutamate epimerase-like enolase superfamily enzyme